MNTIKSQSLDRHLLCFGIAAAALGLMIAAPGRAQTSSEPKADEAADVQEIVVTGSRLPIKGQPSASPIVTISHEEMQLRGTTRIEDLLNTLPQVQPDMGGHLGNRSAGTATVNLRNLGSNRTLVLIDGRRLMPGDPTARSNVADLNNIPAGLVDRVEVLTGGASTVYGADAVAGVVNFIMMKDFAGLRIEAQTSFYQHKNDDGALRDLVGARSVSNPAEFQLAPGSVTDGETHEISILMGANSADGAGNITAYASYRDIGRVLQGDRDTGACALSSGATFGCSGSFTNATGNFLVFDLDRSLTVDRATGNTFRDFIGSDQYNTAPLNYYQRPDKQLTLGALGRYEFSSALNVYTQLMFADDRTSYQVAPTGLFNLFTTVSCSNPFLSASQRDELCVTGRSAPVTSVDMLFSRRNAEGEGRKFDLRHTAYRLVLGARGALNEAWNYDLYGQYGTAVYSENVSNDFSLRRTRFALDAVVDPSSGEIVCNAALAGFDPQCVPYNPFTLGAVTPAMLDYLQVAGFMNGYTSETVVSGSISGDLSKQGIKTPWANKGLGVVLGAEYRRQALNLRIDTEIGSGDLSSLPALPDQKGSYDTRELFSEVRLPILEDAPWAKRLSVEAGYRYSKYSQFSTDTYKVGGDWAPVQDIAFRVSYQRAVRVPNIFELFSEALLVLDGTVDPCAGADPVANNPDATAENCARTGVLPGQYGAIMESPSAAYNGLTGGNPDLNPEKGDTLSLGFVLTPRALPGLSLALDWFDIELDGAVGAIGSNLILERCLAAGEPFFCSKIHRSPGTGSLWLQNDGFVENTNFNLGSLEVKGVDVEANYRTRLAEIGLGEHGSLNFNLIGSWTESSTFTTLPGDAATECTGFYGPICGTPIAKWRHKALLTWTALEKVSVSASWRHFSKIQLGAGGDTATSPATDLRLPAANYFDLSGAYDLSEALRLRVGVNNVFDRGPPVIGGRNLPLFAGNGNTFPQFYDTLGRYVFFSLTADL